ncbi:MAG: Rrf2 family transcriptional regulator [Anaerolineae bacterium]|nr:Rrf2 family transcriptional regulator [Anaerolineae bacterium]
MLSIDSELTPKSTASKRVTPAKAKVIAYLQANPSAAELSVRKLAELTGVNHETVRQVLQELRGQR